MHGTGKKVAAANRRASTARPSRFRSGGLDGDPVLWTIQRAWTRLARIPTMRSSFELLLKRTGVSVERSAYLILVFLNQAGQARLTDIADAIGIDLSTLSRQAAILEQRGLVTREIDPADGRQRILQPTAEGEVVLGKIAAAHHDFLEETFEGWSEQDRKMLSVLLDRLANDVDQFLEDSLPDPS